MMRYSKNSILASEKIYGAGFNSPGGAKVNAEFLQMLNLQPGVKVLEVGCGLGGNAFQMAMEYKLIVLIILKEFVIKFW